MHDLASRNAQGTPADWFDGDLSPDEFRRLGYRAVDLISAYLRDVRDLPVFPAKRSDEIAALFEEPLPQAGQSADSILDAWSERVLPNTTHLGSPRYFGFVNGSGSMMGILADALAASVNMNVGGWKASPAATEIERRTIRWLAEITGYDPACGGLLTSGGQMANFTALLTALRSVAPYDMTANGLQDERRQGRFLVYMSDHEGHVSIVRAVDLMNLGRDAIRRVPSRADFTMDVAALRTMIEEDRARGDVPFCVVGQVGSINVGAIDPLEDIAEVCREFGLWFHADGACGAVGAMLPEKRPLYRGLDRADSLTLDPHKWLYVPYECGCVLVRRPEALRHTFSMQASYLRGTRSTGYEGFDYFDNGPQMSRGFRALKVWMTIKHYGLDGYQKLLSQNVRCAEHLDLLVRADADFEPLHRPVLNIYAFRFRPARMRDRGSASDAYLDDLNQRIVDAVQASGVAFMMSTRIHGRTCLRLSICSHRTTPADIDLVFERIRSIGQSLDAQKAELSRSGNVP